MPDASNVALPANFPVVASTPPVPTTARAQRCGLAGRSGRLNAGKPIVSYVSGKNVIVRNLKVDEPLLPGTDSKLPLLVYRGHNVNATGVQISPSGAYCASGDERGKLRVWAVDHEEHLAKFDGPALSGPILDIAWDGESKRLAVGGERSDAQSDGARVIQWDTGVSVGQLGQHVKGRTSGISFKPQRPFRIVTSGREDNKLTFNAGPPFQKVPTENGIPCETAHAAKGSVNTVRYNHAGTLVASTGGDKMVALYDGKTLELKGKLENVHNLSIFALEWSDDDKHIVTCSSDGKVKLLQVSEDGTTLSIQKEWDPPKAQMGGKAYDKVPVGGQQLGCTFVNGSVPLSVSFNGQLCLLPMADGEEIQVFTGHAAAINDLAVDHKNGVFYTGDSDGLLCQWDLATAQPKKRVEPANHTDLLYVIHSGAISGLTALADGSMLSVGWDDQMYVTDSKSVTASADGVKLEAQPSGIASGTNVAVIITVQGIQLVKGGKPSGSMLKTDYTCQAVCVSQDDKTVYVGGDDCKIHIYSCDGSSLKESHVIADGHRKPLQCLSLSNDESKLAAGDGQDVCVYDLKDSYKALIGKGRWCFHTQRVTCLTWSPDDKILASGGADDSIYLWSLDKKMKRKHFQYAHRGGLTGLEFTKKAGEYKLISVGMDACVNQWDLGETVKETFGL